MTKAQIIQAGLELGVDYGQTVSCYQANSDGLACGNVTVVDCVHRGFLRQG